MKKLLAVVATITALLVLFPVVGAQVPPVSRGGQLYDEWWKVTGAEAPTSSHPVWATQSTNTRTGEDTWRCKECHGWDYLGAEGAYGSGSHQTGFVGVYDAGQTMTVEQLVGALNGSTNSAHDFSTAMNDADINDLASFLKTGLVDPRQYIDYATGTPKNADANQGKSLYDGLCGDCHGLDGTTFNFASPEAPEFIGTLAVDNPQEFLHKARFGQPGSNPMMPSTFDLGWSIQNVVDVMAYAQTLPTGTEATAAPAQPEALPGTLGSGFIMIAALLAIGVLAVVMFFVFRVWSQRRR